MFKSLKGFQLRESAPRILADFLIVQVAALISMVYVLVFHVRMNPHEHGPVVAQLLERYYTGIFLPLSPIFPIVFLFNGIYTHSRKYSTSYKWRVVGRSCLIASALYVVINFFLTRAAILPRGSLLLFTALVICGAIGIRWFKHYLFDAELAGYTDANGFRENGERILIIGGAGYIGSVLVRKLLEQGRKVRILDSLIYGGDSLNSISGHPNLEVVVGDCRNIQVVVNAVKNTHSIVHLAAIVGDPACEHDRKTALEINYAATRMIIEIAKGHGVERLVFASSCSVYGASDYLIDENGRLNPVSLYAQTKVDSENALLLSRTANFHPTILRLATVFGSSYRPRFDLVVNLLAARARQEGVITIYNRRQWRPFIHTRDVAAAIIRTLDAPLAVVSGEIFNVGDSKLNYTLADVAERIRRVLPETRVEHVDNADRRNYRVAFDKIKERLGFECAVSLEEGILEIKEAMESGAVRHYMESSYHNYGFLKRAGMPLTLDDLDTEVMAAFSRATRLRPHRAQQAVGLEDVAPEERKEAGAHA